MRTHRTVAILGDDPDWHARRLTAALAARGVQSRCLSLRDCSFDMDRGSAGLRIPGFAETLPDGVLVRLVASGTLEQITLRLGILHALGAMGIPVCNDAHAVERTVDKSATSFVLHAAGIPTPPTWVTEQPERARDILRRETVAGGKLVLKPLFGSQGKGLRLLDCDSVLPAPEEVGCVYYLQRYVGREDGDWHDWRIFVVGGRAVAAMIRRGQGWITNVLQGARPEPASPEGTPGDMAVAAAEAVGAAYAGVDLVRDIEGRFHVLEVNSVPAWKGLQAVTDIDVAQAIIDPFLDRLPEAAPRTAAL